MGKYVHEVRLKNQSSQRIIPDQIILHSLGNANNFEGGWGWMVDPGNQLEAHIAIRLDGYRRQAVPYEMRADANYTANGPDAEGHGALSCETDSTIDATEPWTHDQVESIIEWCTEMCIRFGIPARLCPGPNEPGIGYHIQFGTPGSWTPVAKACPGPARIGQVPMIIARVAASLKAGPASPAEPAAPSPSPSTDWFNMINKDDEAKLRAIFRDELDKALEVDDDDDGRAVDEKVLNPVTGNRNTLGQRVVGFGTLLREVASNVYRRLDKIEKKVGIR